MLKLPKKRLEEILELGKKLFVLSESSGTKSLISYTASHDLETSSWLSYKDKKIEIINSFLNLEVDNSKQGPYHISLSLNPDKDKFGFSCYFYGAPKLEGWLKKKIVKRKKNFKEKKFRIDSIQYTYEDTDPKSNLSLKMFFKYHPGKWVEHVNKLYESIIQAKSSKK